MEEKEVQVIIGEKKGSLNFEAQVKVDKIPGAKKEIRNENLERYLK